MKIELAKRATARNAIGLPPAARAHTNFYNGTWGLRSRLYASARCAGSH
jgi:hypothetical protein